MKLHRNNKGFSLPEAMVGLGLLAGLGVAGMYLSETMQKSSSGIKSMGGVSRTMIEIRTLLNDVEACRLNLKDKQKGAILPSLVNEENQQKFAIDQKLHNDTYIIKEMKIEKLFPERKRAQIGVLFHRLTKNGRSPDSKKYINVMATISGDQITDCLSVGATLDDSVIQKLCWDADPENFNSEPNDNFDCEDNVAHLVAEVKMKYCQRNGLFGNPATGECRPIDMLKTCAGGSYLRGYTATGEPDCYVPLPPDPIVQ